MTMNNDIPQPSASRKLPPVTVPDAVADPGLIRIGAAVGRPIKR